MNHNMTTDLSRWIDAVVNDSHLQCAQPRKGMFTVYFDNSKRRGIGRAVQHCESEGTLYSSGHVHLDTQDIPVCDFASLKQMTDQLSEWGNYTLAWHNDSKGG